MNYNLIFAFHFSTVDRNFKELFREGIHITALEHSQENKFLKFSEFDINTKVDYTEPEYAKIIYYSYLFIHIYEIK